jgi:hypothetical protein
METFRSAKHLADEKQLDRIMPTHSSQKGFAQRSRRSRSLGSSDQV